jgi:two-component system chemotaxis response regulator CheB
MTETYIPPGRQSGVTAGRKVRVVVVDDSAMARRSIIDALSKDSHIEVVGAAPDPYVARDLIMQLDPDVITLDLEMPRMDGLTFLKILQEHHPVPTIVISSLTQTGSARALEALAAGAIDVVGKPDGSQSIGELSRLLAHLVKAAARSHRSTLPVATDLPSARGQRVIQGYSPRKLIVIGASTGGVEALKYLLPHLPEGLPPIVVVQHIPANFSRTMAQHLDELCAFPVKEAEDGEDLTTNSCLIAPGNKHLMLVATARGYRVKLTMSPPVHHCRPAVDILFRSAAELAGRDAVAALLTGMGVDGARGLLALRSAGARTMAQDERTCVVFGMPQAAINLGAAEQVLPLSHMPHAIVQALAK